MVAVSGLFHIFSSGIHLKKRLRCWKAEAGSKTLLVSPFSTVLKSPQPGSCWYFPFITAVDNCSESATLNHSCHSLCSSTGKYLEIHSRSIVDHKRLSGWKTVTTNVTGQTHTYMNRRVRGEEHWRGVGPVSGGPGYSLPGHRGRPTSSSHPTRLLGWQMPGVPCFLFLWKWWHHNRNCVLSVSRRSMESLGIEKTSQTSVENRWFGELTLRSLV